MTPNVVYEGTGVHCYRLEDSILEVCFNHKESSVNKFDTKTLADLEKIIGFLENEKSLKGVLVTSGKSDFIVGADVTEFPSHFTKTDKELSDWLAHTHELFNRFEDLPAPTVCLISGMCLGGGFEFALTSDYRILTSKASIGLPEVKLGLYPGWGGTVRLPRLIGADQAMEWIATGTAQKSSYALKIGACDAVVDETILRQSGLDLLKQAILGKFNWKEKRSQKQRALAFISPLECVMSFETAKAFVYAQAGSHYPAPMEAVAAMQKSANASRQEAIANEIKGFVKLAKTSVAESLVGVFLSDQFIKKKSKSLTKNAAPIKNAAVLGAGIMGGGIAYQSASKGVPILMKDIREEALGTGMNEACKLFEKQVQSEKITTAQMAIGVASIKPTLSYSDFNHVDIAVEAVVENEAIKGSVLSELEKNLREGAIIASNTSTISITSLASKLKRPEAFCGMHFFNPVHRMPLVEVIRGKQTSDQTIQTVVSYALQMGKTPIVVEDCPGFLVNRILFPYLFAFDGLIKDGVSFKRIDKVMEGFGMPMGPAYLLDVIGIDTALHAAEVMAKGFPDRMQVDPSSIIALMVKEKRLGQKTGSGFYIYEKDQKGKPKKSDDPSVDTLIASLKPKNKDLSDEQIIQRLMIPLINESIRCLEDKIVQTPIELDLALIYGIGFPPFRGGALKYADHIGAKTILEQTRGFEKDYGAAYRAPAMLEAYAKDQKKFLAN